MARKYLPSLEGVRAYAFLWIFAVHYTNGLRPLPADGGLHWIWYLLSQVSWVAVPIFFVLSGYLITGVLLDTKGRGGFFRIFYARRALRVLPLYYLVLALAGAFALASGVRLCTPQLLFLVYLHNFVGDWIRMYILGKYVALAHLWSLALEEQFYLIWPVVVFLIRSRKHLLGFCYALVVVVSLLRVVWPWAHLSAWFGYESSLTRCDGLVLGAILALHARGPMQGLKQLVGPAKVVAVSGAGLMLLRAIWVGQALPFDEFGLVVLMPVVNLIAVAVVVLAIEPTTMVSRLCCKGWAVRLGSMSYSLYVLHHPFLPWFWRVLQPQLEKHLHHRGPALLVTMAIAFGVTYAAALLTYRLVEAPALRMKNRFRYGSITVRGQDVVGNAFIPAEGTGLQSVA